MSYNPTMPLFASSPLTSSPTDVLRSALVTALRKRHRPELGDLLTSADLLLDGSGLWVGVPGVVDSSWLAQQLLGAAIEAGVPLERIQVIQRGREEGV
jgi:hypothetical protein